MTVEGAWAELQELLNEVAPATARSFLPPAAADVVRAAEAQTGLVWPDELRQFYSLHAGQREYTGLDDQFGGQLMPSQDMFSVEQMLSERAMMIEVWQGIAESDPQSFVGGYDGLLAQSPNAGAEAHGFLPQYIPLSGSDGELYFCDLRPGIHHGCIRAYGNESADYSGPLWDSIAAMLTALRLSIVHGTEIEGWEPRPADGQIAWWPAGSSSEPPVHEAPEPLVVHTGYDTPEVSLLGPHDGPGADTAAIARAVTASASAKYGPGRVSGARTILEWVPQVPGFNVGCTVWVDGVPVMYLAVVTDVADDYLIVEVPPQGLRVER